jgi:NADH-quinone oxidoreductase subunit M
MFGPIENPENRGLIDLGLREKFVMLALLLPMLGIGVYPEAFLRRIEPSVVELLRLVESRSQAVPLVEVVPEPRVPIEVPLAPLEAGEAL